MKRKSPRMNDVAASRFDGFFVAVHGHFSPRRDFSQRSRSTQRFLSLRALCAKQKTFVARNKTRERYLVFDTSMRKATDMRLCRVIILTVLSFLLWRLEFGVWNAECRMQSSKFKVFFCTQITQIQRIWGLRVNNISNYFFHRAVPHAPQNNFLKVYLRARTCADFFMD